MTQTAAVESARQHMCVPVSKGGNMFVGKITFVAMQNIGVTLTKSPQRETEIEGIIHTSSMH